MSVAFFRTKVARRTVIAAALWALVVAIGASFLHASTLTSAIEARWAFERVEILRTRFDRNKTHAEFRQSMFGEKSDQEVVTPKGFDIATAVLVNHDEPGYTASREQSDTVIALDSKYQRLIRLVEEYSVALLFLDGALVWAAPLLLLALGRAIAGWVRRGSGA